MWAWSGLRRPDVPMPLCVSAIQPVRIYTHNDDDNNTRGGTGTSNCRRDSWPTRPIKSYTLRPPVLLYADGRPCTYRLCRSHRTTTIIIILYKPYTYTYKANVMYARLLRYVIILYVYVARVCCTPPLCSNTLHPHDIRSGTFTERGRAGVWHRRAGRKIRRRRRRRKMPRRRNNILRHYARRVCFEIVYLCTNFCILQVQVSDPAASI